MKTELKKRQKRGGGALSEVLHSGSELNRLKGMGVSVYLDVIRKKKKKKKKKKNKKPKKNIECIPGLKLKRPWPPKIRSLGIVFSRWGVCEGKSALLRLSHGTTGL